jgi:hypothetical protein
MTRTYGGNACTCWDVTHISPAHMQQYDGKYNSKFTKCFLKLGQPRNFEVFILTIGKMKANIKACFECPKQHIM